MITVDDMHNFMLRTFFSITHVDRNGEIQEIRGTVIFMFHCHVFRKYKVRGGWHKRTSSVKTPCLSKMERHQSNVSFMASTWFNGDFYGTKHNSTTSSHTQNSMKK